MKLLLLPGRRRAQIQCAFMTFKDWSITNEGIITYTDAFHRIFITKDELNKVVMDGDKAIYKWMGDIVNLVYTTEEEVQAFNVLFVYALGRFGFELSEPVYFQSEQKQRQILSLKRIERMFNKED